MERVARPRRKDRSPAVCQSVQLVHDHRHSDKYSFRITGHRPGGFQSAFEPATGLTRSKNYHPLCNAAGFKNDQYAQLISAPNVEPNLAKRKALYSQLNDILLDPGTEGCPFGRSCQRVLRMTLELLGGDDAERGRAAAAASEFYSISQAAAVLGVSRMTLWRWISAGHVPVSRLGHRTTRIERRDLEEFVARRRVGAHDQHPPVAKYARRPNWTQMRASDHFVQFYERDQVLLEAVSGFLLAGLESGEAAVVVATRG